MTEKDLDIAIETCERIMEFDTRTLKNPESENGWLFDKVYDLLQFLRQLQFATDTNVGGNLIDRQAALNALGERPTVWTDDDDYALGERNQYDMDRLAIETVPSAQLVNIAKLQPNCNQVASDCISRQAAISEIMEDIKDRSLHDDPATPEDYAEGYDEGIRNAAVIVLQMPSAQPEIIRCKDCRYNNDCEIQYSAQSADEFFCGCAERKDNE